MTNTADIARAMAATMESASIPMYGNKLRLPDRGAIIALIRELRRLFFPVAFLTLFLTFIRGSCGGCSSPPISAIPS